MKLPSAKYVNISVGAFCNYMKNLRNRFKDQRGFNLIELMIVIAIIGLLIGVGAIAWSAIIKAGNETAAAQMLDRIRTYQASYASRNRGNFGNFDDLSRLSGLDEKFAGENPVVNGYSFTLTSESRAQAGRAIIPSTPIPQVVDGVAATGTRHFYHGFFYRHDQSTPNENRPATKLTTRVSKTSDGSADLAQW